MAHQRRLHGRKTAVSSPARKPRAKPKPKPKAAPVSQTVEAAVTRDIKELATRERSILTCGLAATALALARELDDPLNSATSKSMCARALHETLDRLRGLAPVREEGDRLDELTAQRAKRRSRSSGA